MRPPSLPLAPLPPPTTANAETQFRAYYDGRWNGGDDNGRWSTVQACIPSLVWSRGLMRSCCDVFPPRIGWDDARGWEHPYDWDWNSTPLPNNSVVYVPSAEMSWFMWRFNSLPQDWRLSLVIGQEDAGVPREIFGDGSVVRNVYNLYYPRVTATDLDSFLADPRLLHMFVQNYDFNGCNSVTGCSPRPLARSRLEQKITPIPIGLDFHTAMEKNGGDSACVQNNNLDALRASFRPWAERSTQDIIATFTCGAPGQCDPNDHSRTQACNALYQWSFQDSRHSRDDMWRQVGAHAFAASPDGHGVDTHRFWEILSLGTVPVVMGSSLDLLYSQFPVIRLNSWCDIAGKTTAQMQQILQGWKQDITRQFGPEPFTPRMRQMLTSGYWAGVIRTRHQDALAFSQAR